jgi:hypothetical protein
VDCGLPVRTRIYKVSSVGIRVIAVGGNRTAKAGTGRIGAEPDGLGRNGTGWDGTGRTGTGAPRSPSVLRISC